MLPISASSFSAVINSEMLLEFLQSLFSFISIYFNDFDSCKVLWCALINPCSLFRNLRPHFSSCSVGVPSTPDALPLAMQFSISFSSSIRWLIKPLQLWEKIASQDSKTVHFASQAKFHDRNYIEGDGTIV